MKRILSIGAAVLLLAAPAAAGAEAVKRGGTLRIGVHGNLPSLDPLHVFGPAGKLMRELAGSGMLLIDEKLDIVGDLARKWEVSENGRVITFHLHPGARFHDGTPMDAASVKWNLDLINERIQTSWMKEAKKKNPKARFSTLFNTYLAHIEKVDVVDGSTVRLRVKETGKGQTLPALAGYFTRMTLVSPAAYEKDYEAFKRRPALGGPFRIVEWKPNQRIVMERFGQYFIKGEPYLDRVELLYMPDEVQRINALRAGEIDVVLSVPNTSVATVKKLSGVKLYSSKADTVFSLPVNLQKPVWKDIRVRKAIFCFGIDRQLFARTVMRGLAEPWVSFSPPAARDALDLTAECPYDPEQAKKLLAEAGHGPSNPLRFTITINNAEPSHAEGAQSLQSMYAKLGAAVRVELLDRATWTRAFNIRRVTEMIVLDTIPLMDVNANTHALYSKNAFDYFQPKDPKLDSLIEAWRSTVDPAAQLRISHQLQRYLQDMAYYPAVTGSPLFQATRDYVKGFKFLGRMANDYRTVWLDR